MSSSKNPIIVLDADTIAKSVSEIRKKTGTSLSQTTLLNIFARNVLKDNRVWGAIKNAKSPIIVPGLSDPSILTNSSHPSTAKPNQNQVLNFITRIAKHVTDHNSGWITLDNEALQIFADKYSLALLPQNVVDALEFQITYTPQAFYNEEAINIEPSGKNSWSVSLTDFAQTNLLHLEELTRLPSAPEWIQKRNDINDIHLSVTLPDTFPMPRHGNTFLPKIQSHTNILEFLTRCFKNNNQNHVSTFNPMHLPENFSYHNNIKLIVTFIPQAISYQKRLDLKGEANWEIPLPNLNLTDLDTLETLAYQHLAPRWVQDWSGPFRIKIHASITKSTPPSSTLNPSTLDPKPSFTILDLSTGHLSLKTRLWLKSSFDEAILYRPHGWLIDIFSLDYHSTPKDLKNVLDFAKLKFCDYVLFDADADPIPNLDWYEDSDTIQISGRSSNKDPNIFHLMKSNKFDLSDNTLNQFKKSANLNQSHIFKNDDSFALNTFRDNYETEHTPSTPNDLQSIKLYAASIKCDWVLFE